MTLFSSEYAISPGSLILVTGANSYIATHIIDLLLGLGYNVRGTVRAERPWLNEYFEQKYGQGRFKTVLVQKMEEEGAFDDYMHGVAGVIHVVSAIHQVVPQLAAFIDNTHRRQISLFEPIRMQSFQSLSMAA